MGDQAAKRPATIVVKDAETTCTQKELYRDEFPSLIRAAFGICSAHSLLNNSNKSMLFRILEPEVKELSQPIQTGTLLEALSSLQAFVLCQTITKTARSDSLRTSPRLVYICVIGIDHRSF